jgi:hypothetical protein
MNFSMTASMVGVLNPFGPVCPAGFAEHCLFPGEEPVRVNPGHGAWIAELLGAFDVIWATSWNEDANRLLAPLLGIAPLPVLAMPPAPFQPGAKVHRPCSPPPTQRSASLARMSARPSTGRPS